MAQRTAGASGTDGASDREPSREVRADSATTADGAAEVLSAGLLLTPARPANAFEETVQRLLQSIRLGLIGPGEQLPPERELAVMLAVSRDTVREAIGSLAEAGWGVSRRGRDGGTFVSDELPTASPRSSATDREPTDPRARFEDTLALRAVIEVGGAPPRASSPLPIASASGRPTTSAAPPPATSTGWPTPACTCSSPKCSVRRA